MKTSAPLHVFALLAGAMLFWPGWSVATERENLARDKVVVTTVDNQPVKKGGADGVDVLDPSGKTANRQRPASTIVRVGNEPNGEDYSPKNDYLVHWQGIDWSPKGREPLPGTTYHVTYQYVSSESGHNTTGPGQQAVDGNLGSEWRICGSGWLFVDLGETKEIAQVVVHFDKPIGSFSILYAKADPPKDNEEWENCQAADGSWENPITGVNQKQVILNLKPIKARYVKLVIHKGDESNVSSVMEFELYSTAGGQASSTGKEAFLQNLVRIPETRAAPKIDGVIAPREWDGALRIDQFSLVPREGEGMIPVDGKMSFDAKNLYICLTAHYSEPADTKNLQRRYENRDDPIWHDDSFELQLDTKNNGKSFYHFVVNANEVWVDLENSATGLQDHGWNCDLEIRSKVTPTAWTVEMAIPFENLGVNSPYGEIWGMNIRHLNLLGGREVTSWAKVFPMTTSHTPEKFKKVLFEGSAPPPVLVLSKGNLGRPGDISAANTLTLVAQAPVPDGKLVCQVSAVGENGKVSRIGSQTFSCPKGELVRCPYPPSYAPGSRVTFEILDSKGTLLYRGWHSAPKQEICRTYEPPNPLFANLSWKKAARPLFGEGIFWARILDRDACLNVATRFGLDWDEPQVLREHAEIKGRFIAQVTDQGIIELVRKTKNPPGLLLYPKYRFHKNEAGNWAFYMKNVEEYFRELNLALDQYADVFKGLYTGDEYLSHNLTGGVRCFQDREKYPFMDAVDQEVREKFGFGKFGIPQIEGDPNPFRWIAYHRYCNAEFLKIAERIHKTVREKRPEWFIVSQNSQAGMPPFAYALQAPYVDVFTNQLIPRNDPTRPTLAYMCKLYHDLTGKDFWPCTHVEQVYFGATPREVRALAGQIFMGGGSGFHFWLADNDGRQATQFGSSRRWAAIQEIMKQSQYMEAPNYPEPDFLLFYSNSSHQALGVKSEGIETENWFHLLGPYSGAWGKIVDENTLPREKGRFHQYRALILPFCKYLDEGTAHLLKAYVDGGGCLIAGDPDVFTSFIDGRDATHLREEIFGISSVAEKTAKTVAWEANLSRALSQPRLLKNTGKAKQVATKNAKARILARFEDGDPAILCAEHGKGKALYLAFQLGTAVNVGDPQWQDFTAQLCQDLGLKTKRDIWRFQFPQLQAEQEATPVQGICLTGNFMMFVDDQPVQLNNLEIKGTYAYSVQPNAVPDCGGTQPIAFSAGNLTDRIRALSRPKDKRDTFQVRWKNLDSPLVLNFDFQKSFKIDRVKLFYAGQVASAVAELSEDGTTFVPLAAQEKIPATNGVLSLELKASPGKVGRFVRITLKGEPQIADLALVEAEVWGEF